MNTSQALNFIEEELPATDERDEIVTLLGKWKRIIKRFTKGSQDDE
jgi:UDP-N-acetylglucosamine acyltransferase